MEPGRKRGDGDGDGDGAVTRIGTGLDWRWEETLGEEASSDESLPCCGDTCVAVPNCSMVASAVVETRTITLAANASKGEGEQNSKPEVWSGGDVSGRGYEHFPDAGFFSLAPGLDSGVVAGLVGPALACLPTLLCSTDSRYSTSPPADIRYSDLPPPLLEVVPDDT